MSDSIKTNNENSSSTDRWMGYINKNAKTILNQGKKKLTKILTEQLRTAKQRERKFKKELPIANELFKKLNSTKSKNADPMPIVMNKINYYTSNKRELQKIQTNAEYLTKTGLDKILELNGDSLIIAEDLALNGGDLDKMQTFLLKIKQDFSKAGTFDPDQHFKILSALGYAKEQYLDEKLNEMLTAFISDGTKEMIEKTFQILAFGASNEKVDTLIKSSDNSEYGISIKLANTGRLYGSGIKFHNYGNTPWSLSKIFSAFNIRDYSLRHLLASFIYHAGPSEDSEDSEKRDDGKTQKYQQWYEYDIDFANKLTAILASVAIGDEKTQQLATRMTGKNQVDFLYLGNEIIPKSMILERLLLGSNAAEARSKFYTEKFDNNFYVGKKDFGYYTYGIPEKRNGQMTAIVKSLLEKSGVIGLRVKFNKIK